MESEKQWRDSIEYKALFALGYAEGAEIGYAEGRLKEARVITILVGTQQFGQPDAQVQCAVEAIDDVEYLERRLACLLQVNTWEDLLEL